MRRYLLAASALAFALFLLWGCAGVSEVTKNTQIEYQERGGLSAEEYRAIMDGEAVDEGLDSLQIEAKYFNGGSK
jgi:hypothetical protein